MHPAWPPDPTKPPHRAVLGMQCGLRVAQYRAVSANSRFYTRLRCAAGAGKTYSLSSIQPDNIGMMPRAASELFAHIGRDPQHMYTVTMSYVQIYMEMLQARSRNLSDARDARASCRGSHDQSSSACRLQVVISPALTKQQRSACRGCLHMPGRSCTGL